MSTGRLVGKPPTGHRGTVQDLASGPDGTGIASASGGAVGRWRLQR